MIKFLLLLDEVYKHSFPFMSMPHIMTAQVAKTKTAPDAQSLADLASGCISWVFKSTADSIAVFINSAKKTRAEIRRHRIYSQVTK